MTFGCVILDTNAIAPVTKVTLKNIISATIFTICVLITMSKWSHGKRLLLLSVLFVAAAAFVIGEDWMSAKRNLIWRVEKKKILTRL